MSVLRALCLALRSQRFLFFSPKFLWFYIVYLTLWSIFSQFLYELCGVGQSFLFFAFAYTIALVLLKKTFYFIDLIFHL